MPHQVTRAWCIRRRQGQSKLTLRVQGSHFTHAGCVCVQQCRQKGSERPHAVRRNHVKRMDSQLHFNRKGGMHIMIDHERKKHCWVLARHPHGAGKKWLRKSRARG